MNYITKEFKDNTKEFQREYEKALRKGLIAIGIEAEKNAKREITKLIYSRGGTDKKYRLTGRLRNSIAFALSGEGAMTGVGALSFGEAKPLKSYRDNDGNRYTYTGKAPGKKLECVYIGTNVEYGPYVEKGTSKMRARPFLRPAATEHSERYKELMEKANKGSENRV